MENNLNPEIIGEIEPAMPAKPNYTKYIIIVAIIICIIVLLYIFFKKDTAPEPERKPTQNLDTAQKEKVKSVINDLEQSFPEEEEEPQKQETKTETTEQTEKQEPVEN